MIRTVADIALKTLRAMRQTRRRTFRNIVSNNCGIRSNVGFFTFVILRAISRNDLFCVVV